MVFSKTLLIWAFILIICSLKSVLGQQSFIASFQSKSNGAMNQSDNQFIEFLNDIPSVALFTSCLWIKVRYFNKKIAAMLWLYCTSDKSDKDIDCIEVFLDADMSTASITLIIKGYIPNHLEYDTFDVRLTSFQHKAWGHLCWSFATIDGKSLFHYNGKLIGDPIFKSSDGRNVFHNSSKENSALIFGQEPDSLRGGYNEFQAFIGDMTGFNIWNRVLNESEIKDMADCHSWRKGNIVSWEKSNIKSRNVIFNPLLDTSSLCVKEKEYFIFPKKLLYSDAQDQCAVNGGKIVVPKSKEENRHVLKIVNMHKEQCAPTTEKNDDFGPVWIGDRKFNGIWYEVDSDETITNLLNYSNWKYREFENNKNCAVLVKDGLWKGGESSQFSSFYSKRNVFIFRCRLELLSKRGQAL